MKLRIALSFVVALLLAAALVLFASNLQAGTGANIGQMVSAQRHTPLLWVVDGCAVALVAGSCRVALLLAQFQAFVQHQAAQHHDQLNDMIERTTELEHVNDAYSDRIERLEAELASQFRDLSDQVATLEAAADARHKVFETETRRISDHAFRLFQSQLARNTGQLEAVHRALQLQRDELRRLRQEMRDLQLEVAPEHALRVRLPRMAGGENGIPAIATGRIAIDSGLQERIGAPSESTA
jgi:hypothetical protein